MKTYAILMSVLCLIACTHPTTPRDMVYAQAICGSVGGVEDIRGQIDGRVKATCADGSAIYFDTP